MRPRKNKDDQKLPPRVYRGKSAYEWHPKEGGALRLCDLDASISIIWSKYEALSKEPKTRNTFTHIIDQYLNSPAHREKSISTQKGYEKHSAILKKAFGKVLADKIEPKHIRQYLDKRGQKSKSMANHEIRTLSVVFSWAFERGLVKSNPRKGVKLFTEKPRTRYIEDSEYQAVYERAPQALKSAMEIAYRCGARKTDVLKLTRFDVKDEGLFIWQQKTGKKQIKEWSVELRKAVDDMRTDSSNYIIHNSTNGKYTEGGFDSMWKRARQLARDETGLALDFTFHDLKAKGVSDFDGNKKAFSGHSSDRMVELVYNRKPEISPTLGTKEDKL